MIGSVDVALGMVTAPGAAGCDGLHPAAPFLTRQSPDANAYFSITRRSDT